MTPTFIAFIVLALVLAVVALVFAFHTLRWIAVSERKVGEMMNPTTARAHANVPSSRHPDEDEDDENGHHA